MRFEFRPRPRTPAHTDDPGVASQALAAATSKRDSARQMFEDLCRRHGLDPCLVLAGGEGTGGDRERCRARSR
ncbi:MAG: hypothetical protein ABIO70_28620 [Pseudomonadota bacterium]